MNCLNFEFVVLPNVFIVCGQHKPSVAYQKTFGSNADPMRVMYLKALYAKFKKEAEDDKKPSDYFESKKNKNPSQFVVREDILDVPILINGC